MMFKRDERGRRTKWWVTRTKVKGERQKSVSDVTIRNVLVVVC